MFRACFARAVAAPDSNFCNLARRRGSARKCASTWAGVTASCSRSELPCEGIPLPKKYGPCHETLPARRVSRGQPDCARSSFFHPHRHPKKALAPDGFQTLLLKRPRRQNNPFLVAETPHGTKQALQGKPYFLKPGTLDPGLPAGRLPIST